MTRAQTDRAKPGPVELLPSLIEWLVIPLKISGRMNSSVAVSEAHSFMSNKFSNKLCGVVTQALQLSRAIGEEITSMELNAIVIAPGEDFDSTAMDMYEETAKGQPKQNGLANVICTTDIGLRISPGPREGVATYILKPKVVLASTLEELTR